MKIVLLIALLVQLAIASKDPILGKGILLLSIWKIKEITVFDNNKYLFACNKNKIFVSGSNYRPAQLRLHTENYYRNAVFSVSFNRYFCWLVIKIAFYTGSIPSSRWVYSPVSSDQQTKIVSSIESMC